MLSSPQSTAGHCLKWLMSCTWIVNEGQINLIHECNAPVEAKNSSNLGLITYLVQHFCSLSAECVVISAFLHTIIINIIKAPWDPSPQYFANATPLSRAMSWRAVWVWGGTILPLSRFNKRSRTKKIHMYLCERRGLGVVTTSLMCFLFLLFACSVLFYRCDWILKQDWIFMPEINCYTFILK